MIPGNLAAADLLIVVVYFVGIVWLGTRFSDRQKSSAHYFLGSGKLPGWAVGVSMFATITSSWAFLALPAKAFASDLQYLMVVSAIPIAAWISVRWIVPLFRERIRLSAYEYLEQRFGLGARVYGNLAFLVVHFGKMAAILYLLCLAIAGITGWSIFVLIAIVGVSTVAYTIVGGIEGVVWTDVVQGFLLLIAGVTALGFVLFGGEAGAGTVLGAAWDAGKFKLVSTQFSWSGSSTVMLVFFGLNFYLQKYISDQTVVQRYLLAPDTAKAGRALWISSLLLMGVWFLFMSVGALLWAYYEVGNGTVPSRILAKPDSVFPYYIGHGMPAGLPGLILAGLLAATMSTLASDLNSLSAVAYDDYYRRLRPRATDEDHLKFSRRVVLVAGLGGVAAAMAMTRIHSMADAAFDFVSLVGGGVLGMYLLGLLVPRCSSKALYAGLVVGVTFVLWATFCGPGKTALPWLPRFPLHTLWVGLLGNIVVFLCGWVCSYLWRAGTPARGDTSPGCTVGPASRVSSHESK